MHNNSKTRHTWKPCWALNKNIYYIIGYYCKCGAYLRADNIHSILNHYSGNDVMVSVIENQIAHHNFNADEYEGTNEKQN